MICDLAETYNIYDYRGLSPDYVAVLVFGLRDSSRVKMKLSNSYITLEQTMLAMQVDALRYLCWTKSKDAHKGRPYKEKSIVKVLNKEYEKDKDELEVFETIEEYENYMSRFEV